MEKIDWSYSAGKSKLQNKSKFKSQREYIMFYMTSLWVNINIDSLGFLLVPRQPSKLEILSNKRFEIPYNQLGESHVSHYIVNKWANHIVRSCLCFPSLLLNSCRIIFACLVRLCLPTTHSSVVVMKVSSKLNYQQQT